MKMNVQLVTPAGVLFEAADATLISAAGEAGDVGIEPGHSNLLTTLRIGPLQVQAGGANHTFAVHGGFLEATPHRTSIVADAAETADAIDTERAKAARRRAQDRLRRPTKKINIERAELALKRALLRLDIAGHTGRDS